MNERFSVPRVSAVASQPDQRPTSSAGPSASSTAAPRSASTFRSPGPSGRVLAPRTGAGRGRASPVRPLGAGARTAPSPTAQIPRMSRHDTDPRRRGSAAEKSPDLSSWSPPWVPVPLLTVTDSPSLLPGQLRVPRRVGSPAGPYSLNGAAPSYAAVTEGINRV